jgi:hypothetical protein
MFEMNRHICYVNYEFDNVMFLTVGHVLSWGLFNSYFKHFYLHFSRKNFSSPVQILWTFLP